MSRMLSHVVLISFNEKAREAERRDVYDRYQTLAEDCGGVDAGIIYFQVERNLDLRKNVHLVEVAWFTDATALARFRDHPKHRELTDILRMIADWQVGDAMLPFPTRPVVRHPDIDLMYFDPKN